MNQQTIYEGTDMRNYLAGILQKHHIKKYMVVGGSIAASQRMKLIWDSIGIPYALFRNFSSNPDYISATKGVSFFQKEGCEAVIAVGGGSAMDVAKCIKLFSSMSEGESYLKQVPVENNMILVAVPTTAGTGSESTSFAVVYFDGEKQSVSHESILPQYVVLDGSFLENLPDYQKKCTLLDALCQAIESKWSVNSTAKSQDFANEAISGILSNWKSYLSGDSKSNERILHAANMAGQAINITQTTAAHAMSYKITSMFGIPHGHAVALCLPHVWRYMIEHTVLCSDERGESYLQGILQELADLFDAGGSLSAVEKFQGMMSQMDMDLTEMILPAQLEMLAVSVNPGRLKNNPLPLSKQVLTVMYSKIFTVQN